MKFFQCGSKNLQDQFRYVIVYVMSKNPSPDQKTKKFSEHNSIYHHICNV